MCANNNWGNPTTYYLQIQVRWPCTRFAVNHSMIVTRRDSTLCMSVLRYFYQSQFWLTHERRQECSFLSPWACFDPKEHSIMLLHMKHACAVNFLTCHSIIFLGSLLPIFFLHSQFFKKTKPFLEDLDCSRTKAALIEKSLFYWTRPITTADRLQRLRSSPKLETRFQKIFKSLISCSS